MSQVQAVEASKPNGAPPQALNTPEALQAQIIALLARIKDLETPKAHVGAQYGLVEPSEDYPNTAMKITLSSGGRAIMGPRRKFLDIIDEVKCGRLEAFLTAHPEVK